VDATTLEGKAPGAVLRRCELLGVTCELFGGLVRDSVPAHALSGDPARAAADLEALGERLARALLEAARWVACDNVSVVEARPAAFKAALRAALKTRR
jgi:hypothetical protein